MPRTTASRSARVRTPGSRWTGARSRRSCRARASRRSDVSVREIVLLGDPILRRPAEDVASFDDDLRALVRDLFETMYHAEGIGLAAPQVGVSKRVMVVDLRREDEPSARVAMVNPTVT